MTPSECNYFVRAYLRMKTPPVLSTPRTNGITAVALMVHVFKKSTHRDDWPVERKLRAPYSQIAKRTTSEASSRDAKASVLLACKRNSA